MKVKQEYLHTQIKNPFGPGFLFMLMVEPEMYPFLYKSGYDFIFEVEEVQEEEKKTQNKGKK